MFWTRRCRPLSKGTLATPDPCYWKARFCSFSSSKNANSTTDNDAFNFRQVLETTVDDSNWRRETLHLLTDKNDSSWNTRLHWRKAVRTVNWWTTQNEGSRFALPLLERMIQEVSRDASHQKYVTSDLVTVVVQRWCLDWTAAAAVAPDLASPSDIATTLETYRKHVPSLDERVFRMIQEAASARQGEETETSTDDASADPDTATSLRNRMQSAEKTDNPDACPSTTMLNEFLLRLSESPEPAQALPKAEELLDRMWSLCRNKGWEFVQPDYKTYELVMRCCLRSKQSGTAASMQRLLHDMMKQYNPRFPNALRPGRIHYLLVMSAWAEQGNARKAEVLLAEMKTKYAETGSTDFKPVGKVCAAVLSALSQCQEPSAPDRAEVIFRDMLERHARDGDTEWLPTVHCYTSYIGIWAKSGRPNGAVKAQAVVDGMRGSAFDVRLNKFHYGVLIQAWIQVGDLEKAEGVLRLMMNEYKQGNESAKPDLRVIWEVREAWSRSGAKDRATRVLQLMEGSDALSMLKLLSTGKWKGDTEQAESILRHAQASFDSGYSTVKPTYEHYNATITALSRSKDSQAAIRADALLQEMITAYDKGDKDMKLFEHAFTSVITALSRSGQKGSGRRAQVVFDSMLERWKAGNDKLRPTVKSYSALINAWGQEGVASRAEIVLQQMQDDYLQGNQAAMPNRVAFNTVIAAWSRTKTAESLDRADQILRLMQELDKSGLGTKPDIVSFASIMAACIHPEVKDGPERAIAYLKEAKDLYAQGDKDCKPNCMAYGSVIQAITRSRRPGAAKLAESFLGEMKRLEEQDSKQIVMAYTAVIGVWAATKDPQALLRAESLFRDLVEHSRNGNPRCKPNLFTFTELLKAVSHSRVPDKADKAQRVLLLMKEQGLEPDSLVRRLVKWCG